MKRILFLCVANSARSQMAEGWARKLWPKSIQVQSAGSEPSGAIHPLAIQVMQEIGLSLHSHTSKSVEELPQDFFEKLDVVVTLCAEEKCPLILMQKERWNWSLPDPENTLESFRWTREAIRKKIEETQF